MNNLGWSAGDVAMMATALTQLVVALAALFAIFRTKAEVSTQSKMIDGRFSQLLDLIGRLSGAPERRSPPPADKNGAP